MNKEIEDALHTLLHCSLKDTEYETQFEQYKIVRNYITDLQQRINKAIEYINTTDKWLCRVNDNLCVETIGKDNLLEILGDKENE